MQTVQNRLSHSHTLTMLWIILLVVGFICVIIYCWQRRGIDKMCKQLKTDLKAIPVMVHYYLAFGGDEARIRVLKLIERESFKHGGLTHFWIGAVYGIAVSNVEIMDILSKKCLEKHYLMTFMDTVLGNGSLIAPVPVWRHRRKIISPTFRQSNLNQFVNRVFSRQSSIMVEHLRKVDGKGTFPIWKYVNNYTMDAVLETILGVQLNIQDNADNKIMKAMEVCLKLITARMLSVWLHYSFIYKLLPQCKATKESAKILIDFVDQIIHDVREEIQCEEENMSQSNPKNLANENMEADQIPIKSLTDFFLRSSDNQKSLTDVEFREELLVLLIAGTDTSAVGTSFASVMLSRHPDVQERAYQELRDVFGDSKRPIDAKDLSRLKYLEAVIKETLRLYPPVPIVIRNIHEDIQLSPKFTAAKGVLALFHIWAIHRNPEYWGEDAEVFRPERFLEGPLKNPAAFMPFSCGPRSCLGYKYAMMSMVTSTATLLRTYQLLPATESNGNTTVGIEDPHKPLRLKFEIMMKDADGFRLQIKSRV